MYAPPSDRTSLLWTQLAKLKGLRSDRAAGPFDTRLASARNEVAHFASPTSPAPLGATGLLRKRTLRGILGG